MASILTSIFLPFLQRVTPSLIPERGLRVLDNGAWHSIDNDPQFKVRSPFLRLVSGWVSVRVAIESDSIMRPKLYVDTGEGYSESKVVYMTQIDERIYQADFILPSMLKKLRFDPTEESTVFSVYDFRLRVHSEFLHTIHQFISIAKHDYKKGNDPIRIFKKSYARYRKQNLIGMLERLEKEYKKLHPYRAQRSSLHHINYLNWIRVNEKNRMDRFSIELFKNRPVISIVMATYNTPVEYLKKAIDSVLGQSYPYWELCIADDASQDQDTVRLLEKYSMEDNRIRVCFRDLNGNISIASNSALALASGDYVAFMDHDDMLPPNALLEVAKVIDENPESRFIYSDEDKIDDKDRRYDPHFKPGWNPDLLLSQNYISHLSVIERTLVQEVGAFREGFEGAQDFDLFLRVTEKIQPDEIRHIEKILYHWRAIEGSTALDPREKLYTSEIGCKVLEDFFSGKDDEVMVERGMLPNTFKPVYPLRDEPLVSLIIPTRDGYNILSLCIKSILEKTLYRNYEIIIIDNQTSDVKTLKYLDYLVRIYQNIRVVKYDEEFNYAAINNFGVDQARGELIGLVNNDVEVISDHWLSEMVQHAVREEIGAVGAKLYYDNDTIQHAGVILGIGGVAGHSHKHFLGNANGYFSRLKIIQNLSAVTSACLLVKKSIYEEVGGMNEEHLKVAFNDVDLCLRIREMGYRNLWTPYVELYHHESISRGAEDSDAKRARFGHEIKYMQKRWGKLLQSDPSYNSNLTLRHENFSIKQLHDRK